MSILLKQEIKYYIINTDVTNNLSLKKRIPCIQYVALNCGFFTKKFSRSFRKNSLSCFLRRVVKLFY